MSSKGDDSKSDKSKSKGRKDEKSRRNAHEKSTRKHTVMKASAAPEVSVIVPVYNVERYVEQCLEGLEAQTLDSLEILLVDDGSTDGSPRILAEAAARDPRMRVISKENGGYGSAINAGLEQARGRYVGIVEPDDLVDPHMFEELLAAARLENGAWADVVKSSYWNYYDFEDGREPFIEASNLMNKMPDTPCLINVHTDNMVLFQHPSIWSAIYRLDFLLEHKITMTEAPGGGWVDNPFFFETLVQAETISWTPAAYYYYRQTNPGSSSYLLDYHIPFERLRDIRALLERIGETNEGVYIALYNRTFDYIKSILEKYGFAESDPEVFGLIKEALESMDRDILYGAKRGIHRDQLEYYEDVMGITAKHIKTHPKSKKPKVSIIVSMKDMRPYVIPCFKSLVDQSLSTFEVIAVDCGSKDRTASVAQYFSDKDGRFTTLQTCEERSIAEGYGIGAQHASSDILLFLDPRDIFKKKFLSHVVRAFEECPRADMLMFSNKFNYLTKKHLDDQKIPEEHAIEVRAAGRRDRLMLTTPNIITNKALRTSFYQTISEPFDAQEGCRCPLTSTKAIAQATRVALMKEDAVARQNYRPARTALAYVEHASALEQTRKTKFQLVADYAQESGDEEIQRGFYCYAVDSILRDLDELDGLNEERDYLADLKKDCLEPYGLLEKSPNDFFNVDSFRELQRLSHLDYERYMELETATSRDKAKKIAESTSYRVGKKIAEVGPKLLPKRLTGEVRKRV